MPPLTLAPPRHLEIEEFPDALGAWRCVDVDELDDEPDDLRLLARLRGLDELELPVA